MWTARRRERCLLAALLSPALLLFPLSALAQPVEPYHLWWAEDLVTHVDPENNSYGTSPSYVRWAGVAGATQYENRSLCTTFVTLLLKQAYGWTDSQIRVWLGSASPNATLYHDNIEQEDGFVRIMKAADIEAGDLLAIEYPAGLSVTGHVATARGEAILREATAPIIANSVQYDVEVVDSSSTGHGPTDTRLKSDGSWQEGAGFGVMRVYADAAGDIIGYTWSTVTASTYYGLATRHLVVGRLE